MSDSLVQVRPAEYGAVAQAMTAAVRGQWTFREADVARAQAAWSCQGAYALLGEFPGQPACLRLQLAGSPQPLTALLRAAGQAVPRHARLLAVVREDWAEQRAALEGAGWRQTWASWGRIWTWAASTISRLNP
ncbi:hypothetical protein ACFP81_08770 [Deinococcus lacus]|uniref:Uncharacterized protein n=1 Tax=Deinococcus lacus TaxID=392561 RepID=A0ABW1YDH6_9DEIO